MKVKCGQKANIQIGIDKMDNIKTQTDRQTQRDRQTDKYTDRQT